MRRDLLNDVNIAVVGAGMAGASVASELAGTYRVALIERESHPGYHTTGRSAALFSKTYGPPVIRALSRASVRFFDAPPAGFAEHALLTPRGVLMIGRADQRASLAALEKAVSGDGSGKWVDAAEALRLCPLLRTDYVAGAVYEPDARDIDVHGLHHGYLRHLRAAGGQVMTDCEMLAIDRANGRWHIETRCGTVLADVVINAAGAWADEVAAKAGAKPVGLQPKRRTAVMIAAPDGVEVAPWPMVVDIDEAFYLKPDAGRLLLSPADETPSPPCDAQPEELDIAIAIDRIERAFDLQVRAVENKWAGLRSFVADKVPVVGYDPGVADFFWLAGQGGYGIQTAPALARLAASLVREQAVPADITDAGVDAGVLTPARFGAAV